MNPTPDEIEYARTVFDALTDVLVRSGRPIPPTVKRAREILARTYVFVASLQRQHTEEGCDAGSENVGTDEVAELLGVTRRTVQRNAESLGGQRISGVWTFPRTELGV
jgi:hypothetical protein